MATMEREGRLRPKYACSAKLGISGLSINISKLFQKAAYSFNFFALQLTYLSRSGSVCPKHQKHIRSAGLLAWHGSDQI